MHLFYQPDPDRLVLEDEEARHCTKVLRLGSGDTIRVTDGRGTLSEAVLSKVGKNGVEYTLVTTQKIPLAESQLTMAICPTRKAERNEWMVEKMTELGVHSIQFVVSENTHRETLNRVVNQERLHRIALSAMKQSQQYYLPKITIFQTFDSFLAQVQDDERYIAYVTDKDVPLHLVKTASFLKGVSVLIGPEGDFTAAEIEMSKNRGFVPVSLGSTRLRTETAAVIACHSVHLAKLKLF